MKRLFFTLIAMAFPLLASAQLSGYLYEETTASTQEDVTFTLRVFCNDKKAIDQQANLAAIRCVIFNGVPGTRFSKPLLTEGEATVMQEYPGYFDDLYYNRWTDFVKEYKMMTKFKKSGDKKSTIYEVTVKASMLRKDLEKNNIKRKLGI